MPRIKLSNVSSDAIHAELQRRIKKLPRLTANRDELDRKIEQLEASVQPEAARGAAETKLGGRAPRKGGRAPPPRTHAAGRPRPGDEGQGAHDRARSHRSGPPGWLSQQVRDYRAVWMYLAGCPPLGRAGAGLAQQFAAGVG